MEQVRIGRSSKAPTISKADLTRVTEETYRQNLQLADTNQTLLLLRKIDEIVLSSVTEASMVMERLAETVVNETDFIFCGIYLRDTRKGLLVPHAVKFRRPGSGHRALNRLGSLPVPLRHPTNPMPRSVKKLLIVQEEHLFEVLKPALPIDDAEEMQAALGIKTFFICPLTARSEVLGTMVVGSTETPEHLNFYQRSLLERLTPAVGVAIDNTTLYAQTQEAAKRLRTANRHLKDLDKAKDEFISMASHQLRTPLTSIKGYLSMLLEGNAGPIADPQKEYLEFAYGGSQRMVNLISDLLNVSRMSAGKFMIEKSAVDLNKVVAEETQQLQQHAEAKGLKLTFMPPKQPVPIIQLDEGKTRQVIMNFIDNAIYYTKKGRVTVTLEVIGDKVQLKVADSGIGVPKAARAKLFSKFFRAENG